MVLLVVTVARVLFSVLGLKPTALPGFISIVSSSTHAANARADSAASNTFFLMSFVFSVKQYIFM